VSKPKRRLLSRLYSAIKEIHKDNPAPDSAAQIAIVLKDWQISTTNLSEISQAAQRSLETVTHLTEYEDDKANRILTAMAFMSAFAAVVFVVIPTRYSLAIPMLLIQSKLYWQASLMIATYVAFILFVITLTIGVACALYAVRPRFNVPGTWKPDGSKPASNLFFEKISEVSPTDWANTFVKVDERQLLSTYIKNSVLETYLIAQKIGLKVKWLTLGGELFFWSIVMLIVLLPLVVATLAVIPDLPAHPASGQEQQQPLNPRTVERERARGPAPDLRFVR
jgi:Pycsar effector protein